METTKKRIKLTTKEEFKKFNFKFKRHIRVNYGLDGEKIYSKKIKIEKGIYNTIEIYLSKKIKFQIYFDFKIIYILHEDIILMSKKFNEIEIILKNEEISNLIINL